jgi:hypothetical protein
VYSIQHHVIKFVRDLQPYSNAVKRIEDRLPGHIIMLLSRAPVILPGYTVMLLKRIVDLLVDI